MKLQTCEVITEACYTGLVGARPAMKFEACYMHYGTVVVIIAFSIAMQLEICGKPTFRNKHKMAGGSGGNKSGDGGPPCDGHLRARLTQYCFQKLHTHHQNPRQIDAEISQSALSFYYYNNAKCRALTALRVLIALRLRVWR